MTYRLTKTWPDPHMQKLAAWTCEMMNAAGPTAALIGCSKEAIVAQAALESAWGASAIGHNLFGIKADPAWHGATQTVATREVINGQSVMIDAAFRDYPSFAESIADHFAFLKANSRYAASGVFNAGSDQAYFQALQRAGYATDPNYATSLMNMLASVKMFTAFMVDDAEVAKPAPPAAPAIPPPGYVQTDTGNLIREDVNQSGIVKGTDKAMDALKKGSMAAGIVATAAPGAAVVSGMDWKLAAVLGGTVILLSALGLLAYFGKKLIDAKANRISMNVAGIA